MTASYWIIAMTLIVALLFSASAYAGNGMGGGPGMMGGQGHGMMGSGGAGMMGSNPNYANPRTSPPSRRSPTDLEKRFEREQLREEIKKKRQELSELYYSDRPDKKLIDQKISELHVLEAEYDRNLYDVE